MHDAHNSRRRAAASHGIGLAAVTGAAMAAISTVATNGFAAPVDRPILVALAGAVDPEIISLKEKYRRPAAIPFPNDNPYTAIKVDLGKKLFFDTRLSAANVLSCASCHSPAFSWGDGRPRGVGHGMNQLGRRSPSIVNAAFGDLHVGRQGGLARRAGAWADQDRRGNESPDRSAHGPAQGHFRIRTAVPGGIST
jgi:cytochrome c peroxidase